MSYFRWNGDAYPMPREWDGLSIEDWFYQLERVRDHLMHVDEEDLEPVYSNGCYLDPEEVLLIRQQGQPALHDHLAARVNMQIHPESRG